MRVTLSILFLLLCVSISQAQNQMFEDKEYLDAKITIHYTKNNYNPSKKNPTHTEKIEYKITGQLTCQVLTFRIENLIQNPKNRSECSSSVHCPVLTGTSKYQEYDENANITKDINIPFKVSSTETIMDEKNDKLVTTYTYSASGTNDMDVLQLEIKPYNSASGQVQPLTPNYVIWLTAGSGFDFKNPKRKPLGNGKGAKWDDSKQTLVPIDGPFDITVNADFNDANHGLELAEVYDQLLIKNYQELDKFLLNPKSDFVIKASGKRYLNIENNLESEGMVEVEIILTPQFVLHPLK